MTGLEQAQGSLKYDLVYLNYSFVSDRSQWAPVADLFENPLIPRSTIWKLLSPSSGLLILACLSFSRQRRPNPSVWKPHQKLKRKEEKLALQLERVNPKRKKSLLKRTIPSDLPRSKQWKQGEVWTLIRKRRRKRIRRMLGAQFKKAVKVELRCYYGWTNTSPHPLKQSLGNKATKAVPINSYVGFETGTGIFRRTNTVIVQQMILLELDTFFQGLDDVYYIYTVHLNAKP